MEGDIEKAMRLVKQWIPPVKTKEALDNMNFLASFYKQRTGRMVNCRWCSRAQLYRFTKAWLEINNHI